MDTRLENAYIELGHIHYLPKPVFIAYGYKIFYT